MNEQGFNFNRNETIARIRTALRKRSGKAWSVTGGRGTAYGWITISAPPARRVQPFDYLSEADGAELAQLLGKDRIHCQGESIPDSHDYYREYVDRAEGRAPAVYGRPYWD
ncbi:MAG TPA: hypothetical protein VFN69_04540 [Rudaea sp.]|nr:hypothetical protein [Rudaea sp.]